MTRYSPVLKASVGVFLVLVFTWMSPLCWAATYYVDATNGNDNNNGASTLTAWKTVAKVNSSTFSPGDNILFKRGELWREKLDVPSSGSSVNHLVFGAYGSGSKPLFLGSLDYDNPSMWSAEGTANCWKTADGTFSYRVGQIYYNTLTGSTSAGRAGPDTTFPRFASPGEMSTNWDFFWDDSSDKLVVYHSGGNPADQADGLEITHEDTASDGRADIDGKQYVTLQDLEVKYTNSHGIMVHGYTHNITINNCNVSYFGGIGGNVRLGNGIDLQNAHDISITNCMVSQGMDEGITLECCNKDAEIYNVTISNNTISVCGSAGIVLGILPESISGARIHDIEISNNTVYDIGQGWIGVSPNSYWCPGISLCNAYTTGTNNIYDVTAVGNDLYGSLRVGVYLKRTSENINLTRNKIHANNDRGVYISQGVTSLVLSYNLIYDNIRSGIGSSEDVNGNLSIYNNVFYNNGNATYPSVRIEKGSNAVIKNNIFYSDASAPGGATYVFSVSSQAATVTSDYNCFYGTNTNIISWKGQNYSLAQFATYKLQSGQDANSLAQDPKFKNAAGGDYSLKQDSPCRDTGTPVGITQDIIGTTIPQGTQVDMGAYEFAINPPPAKPKNLRIIGYLPVYGRKQ